MSSKVSLTREGITVDGEYRVLLCSSLFYFRLPQQVWERRIQDLIATGYNCIDVYFPWNFHEQEKGRFDFSGDKDAGAFLKLCARYGLYVVARPGPYICSEWDGGGLPSWVCSSMELRQNDKTYLAAVKGWFDKILPIIRDNQIDNGGSVILLQLENELDFFACKDVPGMIGALRDMAAADGITVPMFCCAGQGDAVKAGGSTEGVYPTYNFYPAISNVDFDANCREYAEILLESSIPLLVTETGREHSLLKRELLAGAKLLGAYNQVAGSNFGYTQSVNNWGKPLSVITTRYDFGSMITTLGDYNREADEAILFSCLLTSLDEKLARALPCEPPVTFDTDFVSPQQNCLALFGGGSLLGLANVCGATGEAVVKTEEGSFIVRVPAETTLALPYQIPFDGYKIIFSNYELLERSDTQIVMVGEGSPVFILEKNGKKTSLRKNGCVDGIEILFLSKAEAVARRQRLCGRPFAYSDTHAYASIPSCKTVDFALKAPFKATNSLILAENGIYRGGAEISVTAQKNAPLFVQNVSDFLTVYRDGAFLSGGLCEGESKILPPSLTGKYLLRVEKWGHSNFDDPRRKSLRIQSPRGIKNVFSVLKTLPLTRWQFNTYPDWAPEKLQFTPSPFDARLAVHQWNSSSLPLIALYYKKLSAPTECDAVLMRLGVGEAEVCAYVENKLVGEFHIHDKTIDLTEYLRGKTDVSVALLVRKREWTQPVGDVSLLYLKKADCLIRPLGEQEVQNISAAGGVKQSFPLSVIGGKMSVLEVDLGEFAKTDCYGVLEGTGYKATAVRDKKVLARMIAPDAAINQQGGSDTQFYIPRDKSGESVKILVEGLKDGILNFKIEYNKNLV